MPPAHDRLAAEFTAHRPHLLAVAYRLTGSVADAEDAVQEAWLRLAAQDSDVGQQASADSRDEAESAGVRDLPAWLTTVVGRICLDKLRSAAVRRERYVGPWLPEPVVTPLGGGGEPGQVGADPLDTVVRDDGVRLAALVVLDRLTPEQRVAFVLHDAFAVPFAEIAATLDCSVASARQHASRGRRIVAEADPPPRAALAAQRETLERFLAALSSGDLDAVVRLLHPDAVMVGDGGGRAKTTLRSVVGADKVARFLFGLLHRYGSNLLALGRPVLVNGEFGLVIPPVPGDGEHEPVQPRVAVFSVRDGRVATVYDMANPDKLGHVPL